MPAGGQLGSTVEFALHGVNLDKVKEVTLGDGLATGTVLSTEPNRARVRITVPKSAELGAYRLHVNGAMRPVPFVVSKYQEVTVAGGRARSRKDPVPVTLPVVANGIIDEPKRATTSSFTLTIQSPSCSKRTQCSWTI
jgi:hypothetical protein